jgi:energy-coupling factor transporter ATP-binding protein EcfA2
VRDGLDPVIEHAQPAAMTMAFGAVARFRIDFADHTVSLIAAHRNADQATIDHLVDDHVAPRILAAGGDLVLHGSACVIAGRIAVFLGQTGSGKSTLAASLHEAGHRLLGDDAVVIEEADGILLGEPVYPSLRLYRGSIEQVFAEDVATSTMAFYSDKLHVATDLRSSGAPERLPIGAVFVLTEGDAGVTLDLISPADACMAMVENSFALDPLDATAATRRMAQAARLASATACYELAYPYDFKLLPEARARVIAALTNPDCPA